MWREFFSTLSVNWGECFRCPSLRHMRYITAVCSQVVLASGYTFLEMLANKYQNWRTLVFCGLGLGDYGASWRCKLQIVMHSLIILYGFSHCGLSGVIGSASSCCSFLLNCSTLWWASQLSGLCARLSVVQLYLGATECGAGRWTQELDEWDWCMLVFWRQRWKWDKKHLPVQLLRGRLVLAHSRTTLTWTYCVCLHSLLYSWSLFLHEICSTQQLPSGRALWISDLVCISPDPHLCRFLSVACVYFMYIPKISLSGS